MLYIEDLSVKEQFVTEGRTDNPVSKPAALRWQGLSNVDWVTVWFFCWKLKTMTSPTWASCEHAALAEATHQNTQHH